MAKDKYKNFPALAACETCGRDFCRRFRRRRSRWAVIAPHGGGIEPGTSEIAQAIAGKDHSFYAFEGLKRRGNKDLHITSTHFDEPMALSIVAGASRVLAVHGEDSTKAVVFLGGLDVATGRRLQDALERRGFVVRRHPNGNLAGAAASNICNRCRSNAGVQLELSSGLRRACFRSLSRAGRRAKTRRFWELVAAIREALD